MPDYFRNCKLKTEKIILDSITSYTIPNIVAENNCHLIVMTGVRKLENKVRNYLSQQLMWQLFSDTMLGIV